MRARDLDVLGAGRLGRALAERATARGLDVGLWRRQHEMPAPTAEDAEVPVVLAMPLDRVTEVDAAALAGRVVIDATNAWGDAAFPVGWHAVDATEHPRGTSGAVADHLAACHVVKTLNHLSYKDLAEGAAPEHRALLVAGDDPRARSLAARVVATLGFSPVEVPSLLDGRIAEPGQPLFGGHPSPELMRAVLDRHGIATVAGAHREPCPAR